MLNYFSQNQNIKNVKIICHKLDELKHRIVEENYTDSFCEYKECEKLFDEFRNHAVSIQDENLANAQAVFNFYFRVFCYLSRYFNMLQNKDFKASWDALQDCFDELKLVGRFVDIENRREIPAIYELLEDYERLYPYFIFASSEYVIKKSHCSICGKSMQSLACPHIKGHLYFGEVAIEIIDEIKEFQAVSLVSHPENKRCIMELSDDNRSDEEKHSKLSQFLELKLPYLQRFTVKTVIETRERKDILKVGRNEKCSCGSGLKFKNCCEKKLYYKHERNIVTPGKKVVFQYEYPPNHQD